MLNNSSLLNPDNLFGIKEVYLYTFDYKNKSITEEKVTTVAEEEFPGYVKIRAMSKDMSMNNYISIFERKVCFAEGDDYKKLYILWLYDKDFDKAKESFLSYFKRYQKIIIGEERISSSDTKSLNHFDEIIRILQYINEPSIINKTEEE